MFITGENIDYIVDINRKLNRKCNSRDVELYCKYEGISLEQLIEVVRKTRKSKKKLVNDKNSILGDIIRR